MVNKVVTILAIRPDWIRMSEIIKKLDLNFNHVLIHTGQHYDFNLSGSFFKDLNIRVPDYNFSIGQKSSDHLDQMSHLSSQIKQHKDLIESADLVIFLGDSNSVLAAPLIKKMKVPVAHIEAGMRCGDTFMFEEINRIACDHASDLLFTYTPVNVKNLLLENIPIHRIKLVHNTITEVVQPFIPKEPKLNNSILLDIHRQENIESPSRILNILKYSRVISDHFNVPLKMLKFNRTFEVIKKHNIPVDGIEICDLMSYPEYLSCAYHSSVTISDSGTAQEELAFCKTPVLVPRNSTERPDSADHGCSIMLNVDSFDRDLIDKILINEINELRYNTQWLGDGKTSTKIVEYIKEFFRSKNNID